MKKTALATIALMAISIASAKPAGAGQFGDLLIELETSLYYSAQSEEWRSRRSGWISDVRTAGDSIPALKRLLVEFETHINYGAQTSAWRSRRASWLRSVEGASTLRELARLMIDCETAITYASQAPAWRSRRSGWLSRSRGI